MVENGLRVRIEEARVGQFHVPEIDRTLRSVAQVCRERAVGVLLTGMGRDGAAGLLALRQVGAFTIGQDEGTSAVWGMPAAASALDALSIELPLPQIAAGIVDALGDPAQRAPGRQPASMTSASAAISARREYGSSPSGGVASAINSTSTARTPSMTACPIGPPARTASTNASSAARADSDRFALEVPTAADPTTRPVP